MKKMAVKKMKRVMSILLIAIVALACGGAVVMAQPFFGKKASGERLERIRKSPNYRDGAFRNEVETQTLTVSGWKMMRNMFKSHPNTKPSEPLPVVRTDLRILPPDSNCIVWFGHSSYLLQIDGKRILVDPVLVRASPVSFTTKPFKGTNLYRPEDMPAVDYVIVTHDHYDHLDYKTMKALRDSIGHVVTPLGVGAHLEYWGFAPERVTDLDWYEHCSFADGFTFHCTPTRHFSGRGKGSNQTLWGSFVIETPSGLLIFVGGDGGYGPHFKHIGEQFPNIDLALIENGQYDAMWPTIHTRPEELGQVMADLGARHYITVHHGKYALANHPWDEPLENERRAVTQTGSTLSVLTIGEVYPIITNK